MISEKGEQLRGKKGLAQTSHGSQWLAGTRMHFNLTILLVFISVVDHSPEEAKISEPSFFCHKGKISYLKHGLHGTKQHRASKEGFTSLLMSAVPTKGSRGHSGKRPQNV